MPIPNCIRLLCLLGLLLLAGCAGMPALPFAAATPTPVPPPTAAPSPTAIMLNASASLAGGEIRLNYPVGWLTRSISNTLILAAEPELFNAPNPGAGLLLQVDVSYLPQLESWYGIETVNSLDGLFDLSRTQPEQAGYILGSTQPISVSNAAGIYADMRSEGAAARLIVVRKPPYVVRFLAQSAEQTWAENLTLLDAVLASVSFSEPQPTPTNTPEPVVVQPPVLRASDVAERAPGFVLRVGGGGNAAGRFVSARGVAVGPNNRIYLAESSHGVWVFDTEGTLQTVFGSEELLDAFDVAVATNGDVYVADYGSNTIVHFDADGTLLNRWGGTGDAPEQFGPLAPQRLALGRDGTVYALDTRTDSITSTSSIVRFRATGDFIERIALPAGIAPVDLALDPVGNIYLADTAANGIIKVSGSGQEIDRLGTQLAENGIVAGAIDTDRQGYLYVATWGAGLLKFSAENVLLATAGSTAASGQQPNAGEFSLPVGIAAAGGDVVWVSDNSGEYSAVTAMRLFTSAQLQATADAQATVMAVQAIQPGTPVPERGLVRQWASRATASSAYEGYPPENATGPPNVSTCGDSQRAWASADPNGLETLTVQFAKPVYALGVNIHQNFNPGFVSTVELLDREGKATIVYTAQPKLISEPCPYVLEITFDLSEEPIDTVRITLDQRTGANWSEIDAVELFGLE